MPISFGGLASGLDTQAIVSQLMEIERRPLKRLQSDRTWQESRLESLKKFDGLLKGLASKVSGLDSETELRSNKATLNNEDFFSASATSIASEGSYRMKAYSMAQVEKGYSDGFANHTAPLFGTGTISVTPKAGAAAVDITIDDTNNSLSGIRDAINAADAGVTASIINDGSHYRLTLTGKEVAADFSVSTNLSGGNTYNGDLTNDLTTTGFSDKSSKIFGTGTLTLDVGGVATDVVLDHSNNSMEGMAEAINSLDGVSATIAGDGVNTPYTLDITGASLTATNLAGAPDYNALNLTQSQVASQAHIEIDGIQIYGDSNTFSDAVPGVTINLLEADGGVEETVVKIAEDTGGIRTKLKGFVEAYNEAVSFVTNQSAFQGGAVGALGGDSGLNMVKRRLQDMLVSPVNTQGSYSTLSELGLETQRDGTLVLDEARLSEAMEKDLDGVVSLLAGDEDAGVQGVATRFQSYLDDITSSSDGLYVGRKRAIDGAIREIDRGMESMEKRLEQKEENLNRQYAALETLIAKLNSQGDYVAQQMAQIANSNRK